MAERLAIALPAAGSGGGILSTTLPVPAGGAHDHFLDGLLAYAAGVVAEHFLGLLAILGRDHHDVGLGPTRVLLPTPLQDQALGRSPGRHDALTQLTAIH